MSKQLFIRTNQQREWLKKLATLEKDFKERSAEIDENSRFPIENIQALRNLGYPKITLPLEYGGDGLNIYDVVLLQETLASYDASTALSIGWTHGVIGELYESERWEKGKLEFLAKKVADGALINRAVSEAQTGSPIRGGRPGTQATLNGHTWTLSGRKIFTTASPVLDFFLISAWIPSEEKVGFFLVPHDTVGLKIEETWNVVGMRGTGSHDLIIENIQLPKDALVELPSYKTGFKLNSWILHIPATYLGIAQAARDYAVEFAVTHSPNSITGTVSDLPNVQSLIGEMDLELAQARFTIYGAAEASIDSKRNSYMTNEINVAKHVVTNTAIRIVDKAMRLVGAKSLQRKNPLQRYYRDVRAGLHNPPMDDLTIQNLAQTAIKQMKIDKGI